MPPQICPNCQSSVETDATYCERCGLRLPTTDTGTNSPAQCPACGTLNLPGELFCQACGVVLAPVSGQPPPLPRRLGSQENPPPLAEKKEERAAPQNKSNQQASQEEALTPETIPGSLHHLASDHVLFLPQDKHPIVIGRADIATGFFPDIDLEPIGGEQLGVSRRHALLSTHAGKTYLQDLNSTNFTFVNHLVLTPGQQIPLNFGDIVQFGQLVLRYEK